MFIQFLKILLIIIVMRKLWNFLFQQKASYKKTQKDKSGFGNINNDVQDADFEELD